MRGYGRIAPAFWTGETGQALRRHGRDHQLVACYLITCPSSNMIGLYYLPIPTLCHELTLRVIRARRIVADLEQVGFSFYDDENSHVWIPEMARFQVDERLHPNDKRIISVVRDLLRVKQSRFAQAFYGLYRERFSLPPLACFGSDLTAETQEPLADPLADAGEGDGVPLLDPQRSIEHRTESIEQGALSKDQSVGEREPRPPSPKARIKFDPDAVAITGVVHDDHEVWGKTFPAVDFDAEMRKAALWLHNNPGKRRSNVAQFLTNWFSNAQDDAAKRNRGTPGVRGPSRVDEINAAAERAKAKMQQSLVP